MAVPTVIAQASFTAGTGTLAKAWPGTYRADDVNFLLVQTNAESASMSIAEGFVQVGSPQSIGTGGAAGAVALTVFACRATSGAMATPTLADSGDHTGATSVVIRGIPPGLALTSLVINGDTASSSTSVSIPGGTTTTDDSLLLLVIAHAVDSGSAQSSGETNAGLLDLAEIRDESTTVGNGGGIVVITGSKHVAGVYAATTATLASASAQARMSIILPPAAAGDVTAPQIVSIGPNPVGPNDPITWRVTDDTGLRSVVVLASFPNSGIDGETVYDSEKFRGLYRNAFGTESGTSTAKVYTALRSGGWPEPPVLEWVVTDTSGNVGVLG